MTQSGRVIYISEAGAKAARVALLARLLPALPRGEWDKGPHNMNKK